MAGFGIDIATGQFGMGVGPGFVIAGPASGMFFAL